MSTFQPSSTLYRVAAKPSLDMYQILEKTAFSSTQQKPKESSSVRKGNFSLEEIHEKSKSSVSKPIEQQLLAHEAHINSENQEKLKNELFTADIVSDRSQGEVLKSDHLDEVKKGRNLIAENLKKLQLQKKAMHDDDDDTIEAINAQIDVLKIALKSIEVTLEKVFNPSEEESKSEKNKELARGGHISGGESSADDDSAISSDSASNLKNLIIKRTTTKPRSSADSYSNPTEASKAQQDKEKPLATPAVKDDISNYLSKEDKKKIIKIDNKIIEYAESANRFLKEINDRRNKISVSDPSRHESEMNALTYGYLQVMSDIGKLYLKRDAVGKSFLSLPKAEAADPEHVAQGISQKTFDLEAAYKSKRDAHITYITQTSEGRLEADRANLLGGAAAFGTSFFLANTLSRILGLSAIGAPAWIITVFAPIVAGALHTLVATPTAKQFMLRTWKSPALGEMNNYFRLLGSYWYDSRTGECDEKKYVSKNPANTELLTVEERMNESRSLGDIFHDRYFCEEYGYLSYASLYSIKGIFQPLAFRYLNPSPDAAIGIDTVAHAIAGFLSGAIYLSAQQSQRSNMPGNSADVAQTRETAQAEADWLTSLRDDLTQMIASLKAVNKDDPRIQSLSVKLRKTEIKLLTAVAKTGRFSSWWHDAKTQFNSEVLADTLADMAGRIISLYPTAIVNLFCSGLKSSPNPFLQMLGYILPAITLIAPPGFQLRGLYTGLIRAGIQSIYGVGSPSTPPTPSAPSTEPEKAEASTAPSEESDDSVIITLYEDDEEDSDESDEGVWRGQPSKYAEDIV